MLAASVDDEQVRTREPSPIKSSNANIRQARFMFQKSTDPHCANQMENELAEVKSQAKMIFRRLNKNSEQQASIESGQYTLQ